MQNIKQITIILVTLFVFITACNQHDNNKQYRIIIDAGSTSTRLYLYQYNNDNSLITNLNILMDLEEKPGIADLAFTQLNDYLLELFSDSLINQINQLSLIENRKHVINQIQFYSTAGMRALPDNKKNEINIYIKKWIINWTLNNNIEFNTENLNVKTLSGKEEATYDWVAANYLNHFFNDELVGIIDLGGESTEIAYDNSLSPNVYVTANNTHFALNAFSYNLGIDVMDTLMKNYNACYLTGYTDTASGNYTQCATDISLLLSEQIPIITPYSQTISQYFLLAGFYYIADFYNISDNFSLVNLQNKGETFCSIGWNTAQNTYPDADSDYLPLYCLLTAYQFTLISQFYNLNDTSQTFTALGDINDIHISWPVGALVTQSYQEIN